MDDYSALAYRIAGGVADVRGCLILSRDGLILGSYPDDETAVKPAWVRFASLGDPERSFVEFGDQVWVYVRRPAYGAFAVANAGIRPGLVIDQLESILASAEESRNRRDTLRVPEASGGPPAKPRRRSARRRTGVRRRRPRLPTARKRAIGRAPRHPPRTARPPIPVKEELAKVGSGVGRSGDATPADGPTSDPKAKADADAGDDPKAVEVGRRRGCEGRRRSEGDRRREGHVRRGFRHTQRQGCGRARSDGARRRRRGGSGHVGQRVFGAASG